MNTKNIESDFKFVGQQITKLNLENDFVSLSDRNTKNEFDVFYEIDEITKHDDKIWGTINLTVLCKITDTEETEDSSPLKCNISLTINGCFIDSANVSIDKFKEMLGLNGCTALYSIARGIITGISAQSMLEGNITLPLINILQLVKSAEK